MPQIDLFAADAEAGFDEGWMEGSAGAGAGVTGLVEARFCHGIDIGLDIQAAAEANAHLRVLVVGARAQVGAQAHAGVRGRITLDPNLFERFGLTVELQAAAEIAAQARLEIALEFEYVAGLAAQQMDGLALELFLAFLRELRVGGGVFGKVAFSAMARGWAEVAGKLNDGDDAGFSIGGGYAVGLKGGYGMDWFLRCGFENPRRFFTTSVDLITDEVVLSLREDLPPGSDDAIELFRLLVPVALTCAYDVGQKSATEGALDPRALLTSFMQAFAEELQRYLIDRLTEQAVRLFSDLIEEALVRLSGRAVSDAERGEVEAAVQALTDALSDGRFDADDLDELLLLAATLTSIAAPEMMDRFRRPAAMLWTGLITAAALRDVGELVVEGNISLLGLGASARARVRNMPPVSNMPTAVLQEYLEQVADFNGSSLTFDHAIDYLITAGAGPLLETQAPQLVTLLDQLHRATGISPGNIVNFGIRGVIGDNPDQTELYQELKAFVQHSVDEVIRVQVFEPLDVMVGDNRDGRLYMDEVARPSIELMISFLFGQLDRVVAEPSVLGTLDYLSTLQSGLSSLLYKIVARNLVVFEQIASDRVREGVVVAMATLESTVRDDDTSVLMRSSVEHLDQFLALVSEYVPVLPTTSGLDDDQLAAIQMFIAELLNISQEALGDGVFTRPRWNRRREAILQLLLSVDAEIDWAADDLGESIAALMKACIFKPDDVAVNDLLDVHLQILGDQAMILLRRLPGPLAALALALTGPRLAQLELLASDISAAAAGALALVEQALAELEQLIENLLELLESARQALADAIDDGLDELEGLAATNLRSALVDAGQQRLQQDGDRLGIDAALMVPVIDGFSAVLNLALHLLEPLIDSVLDRVRSQAFLETLVQNSVATISAQQLLQAGSGANFATEAAEHSVIALTEALVDELEQQDWSALIPLLTVTLPSVPPSSSIAIDALNSTAAIAGELLEWLDLDSLLAPALNFAYYQAQELAYAGQAEEKRQDRETADRENRALAPRQGSRIELYSPAPLDSRRQRVYTYGPRVPLSLRISDAGAGWGRRRELGGRVQISVNGRDLPLVASDWQYDSGRQALYLETTLRWEEGQVQGGLNVLEVSVTPGGAPPVRKTVSFLLDPDAPLPDQKISIDAAASRLDSPGNDHATLLQEYVAIRSQHTSRLNLEGWRLRDRAGHEYRFGKVQLRSGRLLRIRSGGDPTDDNATDLHWGRRRAVWNNRGDLVQLVDEKGNLQAQYRYTGSQGR